MKKTPIERAKLVLAASVMMFFFVPIVMVGIVIAVIMLVSYLFRDSQWVYKRLVAFGSALDQASNVVLFDGDERETISSHVGRFYEAKYGNPIKGRPGATDTLLVLPWQCEFVKWLTDLGEPDHVYHAVEQWAVDAELGL